MSISFSWDHFRKGTFFLFNAFRNWEEKTQNSKNFAVSRTHFTCRMIHLLEIECPVGRIWAIRILYRGIFLRKYHKLCWKYSKQQFESRLCSQIIICLQQIECTYFKPKMKLFSLWKFSHHWKYISHLFETYRILC